MDHLTSEQAAVSRVENEKLFNDLLRLEEMLETIQKKLNSAGKMHLLSPIH